MHTILSCVFLSSEKSSFVFENWDAVALFMCSISITTTILQGSKPLHDCWKKALALSLQNYGKELFKSIYGDSSISGERASYLNTVSRYIQQKMDQYENEYDTDAFWERYTKLVYITGVAFGVFMLFEPSGCWKLIYLLSFFPLLSLCAEFMSHKEQLKEDLASFIRNEEDIKRLIFLQENEFCNTGKRGV